MSTLDKIKQAQDREVIHHEVPAWGVTLLLKEPTMGEMIELQDNHMGAEIQAAIAEGVGLDKAIIPEDQAKDSVTDFTWALLAVVLYDKESNGRLFQTKEEAKEVLILKATKPLMILITKCGELVGPPEEDDKKESGAESD